MTTREASEATRRALVLQGSAAAATAGAALALQRFSGLALALERAFPARPGEEVLAAAGVLATGREVVFRGADAGEETVRGVAMPQHFARSMSLAVATDANLLLAYEMNGR